MPNIVLILSDDQRPETKWAMPNLQDLLVSRGTNFKNAFVSNPLCCPSRATILTGRYSHGTDVYRNTPPHGGFETFGDTSTVATWLNGAGYRTALVGKYLNGYAKAPTYVPPGWSTWAALVQTKYYDYDLNLDGSLVHFGSEAVDYSTDVLAHQADAVIRGTDPGQPLFLMFTPFAPHGPATPAPRHEGAFSGLAPWRPPSYNEADMSDKPEYMQELPLLTPEEQAEKDELRRNEFRALLAVDDAIGTIMSALDDTGRLSNTMIVYASDNGLLWGEHRSGGKSVPYLESIHVPLVIRYDPLLLSGRNDAHLVLNTDLAPTFAELAGIAPPAVDGLSLFPLLTGGPTPWRVDFLIEHYATPTYCGIHRKGLTYVKYKTGEEELYDEVVDRYQMDNVASDATYAATLASMRARMVALCNPPPPGFNPQGAPIGG
jgi:arylsulfatase A-like enzyme